MKRYGTNRFTDAARCSNLAPMPRTELHSTVKQGNGYLDGQLCLPCQPWSIPAFQRRSSICARIRPRARWHRGEPARAQYHLPKLLSSSTSTPSFPRAASTFPWKRWLCILAARGNRSRLCAAHLGLLCGREHAADRRIGVPHRHHRHSARHRFRVRPGAFAARTRLAAGRRDSSKARSIQWLADLPADVDIVFDDNLDGKYERALAKLGVHPSFLVNDAGHA